jgi:hypothetical protein
MLIDVVRAPCYTTLAAEDIFESGCSLDSGPLINMAEQVEKKKPQFVTVDSLRPGTKGHNLTVKVMYNGIFRGLSRTDAGSWL